MSHQPPLWLDRIANDA